MEREHQKTYICYGMLCNEMIELIDLDLPISQIYEKFKKKSFPMRTAATLDHGRELASFINNDSHRKIHETTKENIWFKDPKLIHRNFEYSRDNIINEFVKSPRNEKLDLIKAYDDIFKTNEWCNEYNYMLDVYHSILDHYFRGEGYVT